MPERQSSFVPRSGNVPSVAQMQAFADSPEGRRATDWAGEHRSAYKGGPAHPEAVADALRPPDGRFYGGAQDAIAILQSLLDAALRRRSGGSA